MVRLKNESRLFFNARRALPGVDRNRVWVLATFKAEASVSNDATAFSYSWRGQGSDAQDEK